MKAKLQNFLLAHSFPIFCFLLSKGVVLLIFFGTPQWLGKETNWTHWDADIYLEIAEYGYLFEGKPIVPQADCKNSIAFFPLYPILLRLLSQLTGLSFVLSGLLLSSLFTLLGSLFLFDLAKLWKGEKVARLATFYFLFAPGSIFLSAIYTESLFCLLVILAFRSFYLKRYPDVGVWIGLACITRIPGLALFPPLCIALLRDKEKIWKKAYAIFLSSLPLLMFLLYQKAEFGDAFAFLKAQNLGWSRHLDWPWVGIRALWEYGGQYKAFHVDLIFVVIILALMPWMMRLLPLTASTYSLGIFLLAVATSWPLSITRVFLTMIPLYLILAALTEKSWVGWSIVSIVTFFWSCLGAYYYLTRGMFV